MPIFTTLGVTTAAALGITGLTAGGTFLLGVGAFALQTAVGLSLAAQQLAGAKEPQSLAETEIGYGVHGKLNSGGDIPRSFPLGWRLTAGSLVYANTWGSENDTPNAYLTQVIALSDIPLRSGGDGLVGFYVNGSLCTIEWDNEDIPRGFPVTEYTFNGTQHLWVKFYDGSQTTADSLLVDTVGGGDRPYESTRVGTGVAYAVVTSRVNDELWTGFPQYKFELAGIKLYDVTKDTTAGGSGTQRWADPATWGGDGDDLPAVQIYNIMRGISYDGKWMYGLQGMVAARLPAANLIAQVEKCRTEVEGPDGDEPTYRSSLEVFVAQEPAETIEQLLTACQGRLAEIGGFYKLHLGAPDAAVMSFTDDDIISTQEQSFTPFFGLSDTVNGITGTYPEPDEGWNNKAAPPLYRSDLEALAGNRRLLADPKFDAVPYSRQVQQLMKEALQEAQRARRHTFVLPPSYWALEPGDVVEWTSARNGYVAKLFRVDGIDDRPDLDVMVDLTEVDPADYNFNYATDYDAPAIGPLVQVLPPAQAIIDFAAAAIEVTGDGEAKRPGILLTWDGTVVDDIAAVQFEVRRASDQVVIIRGRVDNVAAGSTIIEGNGLLPATDYEVRGRYIPKAFNRATTWSGWIAVTTPDTRFTFADIDTAEFDYLTGHIRGEIARLIETVQGIAFDTVEQDAHNTVQVKTLHRFIAAAQGDLSASIEEVGLVVATTNEALAQLTTTVTAQGDGLAQVQTELIAFTGPSGTFAQYQTSVAVELSGLSASVTTVSTAVTNVEGFLAAAYAVTLDVNGYASGFQLYNGGSVSSFTVIADYFQIAAPGVSGGDPVTVFEVGTVDGVAAIKFRGALYGDGDIVGRHIAAETITGDLIEAGTITGDHLEVDTITVREILSGSATALADATGATESDPGDLSTNGFTLVQVTMTLVTGNVVVFFDAAAHFDDGNGADTSRQIELGLYVGAVEKETRTFTAARVVVGGTETSVAGTPVTAWPLNYECIFDGSLAFMARLTGLSAGSTTFYIKIKDETFSAGSGWSGEVRTPRIAVFESRR